MAKALVLRAAGTNCDQEMVRAFAVAGAEVDLVHLDAVIRDPDRCDGYDLFGFPGGFSFGDDIASGRIFAMKVRERLYPALRRAIERRCPMIGACNGFQVLVQVGLLPGPEGEWPVAAPVQTVALSDNQDARFHDRWVPVTYEPSSVCVWTRGLSAAFSAVEQHDVMQLPVAHGEGRFVAASEAVLRGLESRGQVAVRYNDNYNGSQNSIAGICDASGLVFGLMPHPERFLEWNRHPWWTRLDAGTRSKETPGLLMFRNAVEAVAGAGV
ncbi:MAG TPA: phosphoribosylformylglycinamidine synthase subunit PurQ [Phycisphaerales bacterium]|nr:phosphoribosylformylglycinamidine synthase subunit PurQ [Phycisphaerales bacterium]